MCSGDWGGRIIPLPLWEQCPDRSKEIVDGRVKVVDGTNCF